MSETGPAGQAPTPQLPPRARRRRGPAIITAVVAVVVVAVVAVVLSLAGRGGAPASAAGASGAPAKTVSIGVADISQPHWKAFNALAKQRFNVTVKLVNFTDYSQPNPALSQGQTDLNEFQHLQYLANYNVTSHDTLQPIGATAIYPLPLYSVKYASPSALPKGAKVAIPNDAVNEARGLLVLQSAGLVTLKGGGTAFSTTKDIATSRVTIQAIDASQTANAVKNGSVAAAIVNKNYAIDAKLTAKQAIAQDDPKSASAAPYVNAFVARKADAANPLYLKLAALYQDKKVADLVQQENGGSAVFQSTPPKDLQATLAKVEADAKAAK
jgi:D-methionine transport system substrate-binding protein